MLCHGESVTAAEISVCTGKRGDVRAYGLTNKSEVFYAKRVDITRATGSVVIHYS